MGFKVWLENLLLEHPHIIPEGNLPPQLAFMQGNIVDFNFERLDLSKTEYDALRHAYDVSGVIVPGYGVHIQANKSSFDPVDAKQQQNVPTLPHWWKRALLVTKMDNTILWIGRTLIEKYANEYPKIDFSKYKTMSDGWMLADVNGLS